jgi:hypothetical protein
MCISAPSAAAVWTKVRSIMPLGQLKRIVRPFVPVSVIERGARRHESFKAQREIDREAARRQRLEGLRSAVSEAAAAIAGLTQTQCGDARFLEHELIPILGLNDEILHEQPQEFSARFGTGLHIWQYPNQLAGYLVWLSRNVAEVTSYVEIGCRWGGMFILLCEWIQKNGGSLRSVTAVDLIEPSPLIDTYFRLLHDRSASGGSPIETTYLRDFSTSPAVAQAMDRIRPDFAFIDGDHLLRGALADHMLIRKHAKIISHHDIFSQAWPETTFLWETLKELERRDFEFFDFVDQYPSVKGHFLGIGAMKRKE